MTSVKLGTHTSFTVHEAPHHPGTLQIGLIERANGIITAATPYSAMAMASALLSEAALCMSRATGKDECEALANLCNAVLRRLTKERS